jgi:tetratricopeptide (TPR) repeat protein
MPAQSTGDLGAGAKLDQSRKAKKLESRLKSLMVKNQPPEVAAAARALLQCTPATPASGAILRKATEFLARSDCAREAESLLHDMLSAVPVAVSGRVVKAVLHAGAADATLERLCEGVVVGTLSFDVTAVLVHYLRKCHQTLIAIKIVRAALENAPENVRLRAELAGLLHSMNDVSGARSELESAIRLAPEDARLQRQLGRLEVRSGDLASAELHLRIAVNLSPKEINYWLDLGWCLLIQKRFDDVIAMLRGTVVEFPDAASVHALLGHSLRWAGRHAEALESLTRALELDPDNAEAMIETAKINEERGDCETGLRYYGRAAEIRGPTYNATRFCYALLGAGRTREAWAANMNRVECRALLGLPGIRMWAGEPLDGKSITVISENGVGDQIRDSSTFPDLIAAAGRVTVACDPRLASLFRRSFPQARFLPVRREHRVTEYERMLSQLIDDQALNAMRESDACVLTPDLHYYFRDQNDRWGHQHSYLTPDPNLIEFWRDRVTALGQGLKIGISWRSGVLNYNRECLYTRILDWGPILTLPGVHFINLQYDECDAEIRLAEEAFGIRIHAWEDLNRKDDFDGVSALLKHLDLVLAPNTTVLEHAGALGVPALYMVRVPVAYDHWRRKDASGQDRIYPSVRHIYGDRHWDSASLMANTAAEIKRQLSDASHPRA